MALARRIADAMAGFDWVQKVLEDQRRFRHTSALPGAPQWASDVALAAVEAEARARVEKLLSGRNQAKEEKETKDEQQ
jgi:hypothetical protein